MKGIHPPKDTDALKIFTQCFRIWNSKFMDDDDCKTVVNMLEELAEKYQYAAASLNLGSIYEQGLDPGIKPDKPRALSHFVDCLASPFARRDCSDSVLEETAMAVANLDCSDHIDSLAPIAEGQGVGGIPAVRKWVTFAVGKKKLADRSSTRTKETDPGGTPSVSSKEGATTQDIERQSKALELKEEGNILYKQGAVAGNKNACRILQAAVEKYQEAFSLQPDGIFAANCAMAYVKMEKWSDAAHWSQKALDHQKESYASEWTCKVYHRLALSLSRLKKWTDAAAAIDRGLSMSVGTKSEFISLARQLPAEEIEKYAWSQACEHDQPEHRLCGRWIYPGGTYDLRMEQWGSFVFEENDMRVELTRNQSCQTHWFGEFPLIPGLRLDMRYNAKKDTITSTFTPPEEMKDEAKKKLPPTFVATRAPPAQPEAPAQPETHRQEEQQPTPPEPTKAVGPEEVTLESAPSGFNGTYRRELPDVNDRPRYILARDATLWYRGQWGISERQPDPSPFKCPFVLRMTNSSGYPHPLFRPGKWEVGENVRDGIDWTCHEMHFAGANIPDRTERIDEEPDRQRPNVIYATGPAAGYYHKNSDALYTNDDARIEHKHGRWYISTEAGCIARSVSLVGCDWERADLDTVSMLITRETTVYRRDRSICVRAIPDCIEHASAVSGALVLSGGEDLKHAIVDRIPSCVRLTLGGDVIDFPCNLNEGKGRVKWSKHHNTLTIT